MTIQLPDVIGHRGACFYAPENTLASLYKAHALGVKWVEFDVTLTQDGQAIVMHDATLNRTTNGRGSVAATASAQIAQLDAGSWFAAEFSKEKVPSFAEYLACATELDMGINVEIKPTPGKDVETAQIVIDTLHKHWPHRQQKTLVSSFSSASITQARAMDDQVNLALILSKWQPGWQTLIKRLNCISLHLKHSLLSRHKVAEIKTHVPYVLAYTVNDNDLANTLFSMGVDAVFSDAPDRIKKAL